MPIRPEMRNVYPPDWKKISERIRKVRAGNRCECTGQCGTHHGACGALNYQPHPRTGSSVVLTVMHLDHDPSHCDDENLMAGCQACHLAYDRDHHAQTRLATRERRLLASGQQFLPLGNLTELASIQKGMP
jgi:hypothetical protein